MHTLEDYIYDTIWYDVWDTIYDSLRNSIYAVTDTAIWFEVHDDLQLLITIAIEDTQVAVQKLTEATIINSYDT